MGIFSRKKLSLETPLLKTDLRSEQLATAKERMSKTTAMMNTILVDTMNAASQLAERLKEETVNDDAIIFVRASGKILFANAKACDILQRQDLINAIAVKLCRDDICVNIPQVAEAILKKEDISKLLPGQRLKKGTFELNEPMKVQFADGRETQEILFKISLVEEDPKSFDDITFVCHIQTSATAWSR